MKIFTSFHHARNNEHAKNIIDIVKRLGHDDISVNDGNKIDDSESMTSESIRQKIRDKFLKDVDVTIVIVGSDSRNRKHIDWEIRSTIRKSVKKDGTIVVVNALANEETWILNQDLMNRNDGATARSWSLPESLDLSWLPERLENSIMLNYSYEENLKGNYKHAVFPIVSYDKVINDPEILNLAILQALEFRGRNKGKWDLSKMRRNNNESLERKTFPQVEA